MTELLIVGGLTVDRFADGRSAPGGSVLHAALAAVEEGVRPAMLTVAGEEPEARDGLARLAGLGDVVHRAAGSTATYRHVEQAGRRILVYEAATDQIDPALARDVGEPEVALLAPIADEFPVEVVGALRSALRPRRTVLLIQGWLRRLVVGAPVEPLPLDALGDDLWAAFGGADAVVLSTEDLAEATGDPFEQAAALRRRLGPAPVLVLTLGAEGVLLDDPAAHRVVATMPRRVVEGAPTIGAGDAFGAAFAVHLSRGADPATAASAATERVIRLLESRIG